MELSKHLVAGTVGFLNMNLPSPTLAHQVCVHDSTKVEGKAQAEVTGQMAKLPLGR